MVDLLRVEKIDHSSVLLDREVVKQKSQLG